MITMNYQGRAFTNAVAVGRALGMTGSNAGLFADVLARTHPSAKVEDLAGNLYIDVDRLPISAEARPGFNARLAAVRPLDLAAGAVVHRPFADPHHSVATPAAGSVERARANARAALGPRARKGGPGYLERAASRVAELRQSPGSTMTTAAPALPATAARPARPAGNTAADMQNAFGLDPANAARLAAATIPSAPSATAPVRETAESILASDHHYSTMAPGPKRDSYKAAVMATARQRGFI